MTPAARERWQVQLPILSITAIAWAILVLKPGGTLSADSCCRPAAAGMALSAGSLIEFILRNSPAWLAFGWFLMLVAMMSPMLAVPVRYILDRSFVRRRIRAVLLFLTGYTAIWMIAGMLITVFALAIPLLILNSSVSVVLVVGIVLIWQCSPFKQRCLNRGHSHTVLAAFGMAADIDSFRFGIKHGLWCVGSCWALMLLPELFSRGHVAAMAAVTLWLLAERLERPMPPSWRLRGVGKAARVVIAQVYMLLRSN